MNEDELRAAMRAHDAEAPRAAEFPVRPIHRRPALPIAAAVIVTAAVVAVIAIVWIRPEHSHRSVLAEPSASPPMQTSHEHGQVAAAQCPDQFAIPTGNSKGFNQSTRLAPNAIASAATLCTYARAHLLTATAITANVRALSALLADSPKLAPGALTIGCVAAMPAQPSPYMLAMTYGQVRLWVKVVQHPCVTTASNGAFMSPARLLMLDAMRAGTTGRWPDIHIGNDPCAQPVDGRFGQGRHLVPSGSSGVTICSTSGGRAEQTNQLTVNDAESLISVLNSLTTRNWRLHCSGRPSGTSYRLLFHYRSGPDVEVNVKPHCHPEIENGALQSDNVQAVVPLIEQLLR